MILKWLLSKNPLPQAVCAAKDVSWGSWACVGAQGVGIFVLATLNVHGAQQRFHGDFGDIIVKTVIVFEFLAFVASVAMAWQMPSRKVSGLALILAYIAFSVVNVTGAAAGAQLALEREQYERQVKEQFTLDRERDAVQRKVDEARKLLPKECDRDKPYYTACGLLYDKDYAKAVERGDVAVYKARVAELAKIPAKAETKPLAPPEAVWVLFFVVALVMLYWPAACGFGRPDPSHTESATVDPQATLNPIPDEISPPDGEAKPHLPPVTPQEVEQNVPPPVPNPWPPEGFIPGGVTKPVAKAGDLANSFDTPQNRLQSHESGQSRSQTSIEDRVRAALRTPGADGKMPSVNEVAKALGPEIKRWRVQQIAAEMRGAA